MDPNDPNYWFQDQYSPNYHGQTNPDPTAPIHTPIPQRPQGFLPYVQGIHGFSVTPGFHAASSSPPLFPSPPQGPSRLAFSPISRMSSLDDSDDSSRQTPISLADESDPVPEPDEVSSPPRRPTRGRRLARGAGRSGGRRGGGRSGEPPVEVEVIDDGPPRPYTEAETHCLARVWVDIGSDPITGTNQRIGAMWQRISLRYNELRPRGTPPRGPEKLRNHWKRAMADIKQFESCYTSSLAAVGSGESGENVMGNAQADFYATYGKMFKHLDTWKEVRETAKFQSAVASTEVVKRCKQTYEGAYSTSGSEHDYEEASGSAVAGYRPRPEGCKAAKERAKGKSRLSTTSSDAATEFTVPGPRQSELDKLAEGVAFSSLYDAYTKPTAGMDPETLLKHNIMCDFIEQKLGLKPRNPPPPQD